MSRDSTHTYVHTRASHLADLFEDFCRPPSAPLAQSINANSGATPSAGAPNSNDPSMVHVPGHFLPFEEIQLAPHLMPVNPEDEDDLVPDMHAAFGIQRALAGAQAGQAGSTTVGRGAQQEPVWRELGMEALLNGVGGLKKAEAGVTAARREGKKTGLLLIR